MKSQKARENVKMRRHRSWVDSLSSIQLQFDQQEIHLLLFLSHEKDTDYRIVCNAMDFSIAKSSWTTDHCLKKVLETVVLFQRFFGGVLLSTSLVLFTQFSALLSFFFFFFFFKKRYSLISLTCADFASTTLIFLFLLNKNTVSQHSLTKVTNSVKLSVKKWHHHHTKRFSSTLTSLFLTKIFSFISDNSAGHHLATTVSNIKPTEAWSPFTGSSPACLSVWCTSICLQCNMFEEQLTLIITTMSQWQTCFTTTRTDILIYVVSTASGSLLKVSRRPKFSSHFFPF